MAVFVLNKFQPNPYPHAVEVDTTSKGSFKDLSPFFLGPVVYDCPHFGPIQCNIFENLWQYCKVYPEHFALEGYSGFFSASRISANPKIMPYYYQWRNRGFASTRAARYPMGKGAKPAFSLWRGIRYGYIDARKNIYAPIYAELVRKTESYRKLYNWVMEGRDIVLRDFDGYDYSAMGMTLTEVINDPKRIMGHAFVLAMLLTGEPIGETI
jgi:hypothetical protein